MMLRLRALVTSVLIALPVAALVVYVSGRTRMRDMELALSRVVRSQVNEQVRERCESDPRWFLTGPLDGRPKRGEIVDPNPELQPRPKVAEQPFELFAYGDGFTASSSAGPRFPPEFRQALQRSSADVHAPYTTPEGTGVQMAVSTGWLDGPCMYLLGRMAPPANQRSQRWLLFGASVVVTMLATLVAAAENVFRVRRLAEDARVSASEGYAAIAPDKHRDELSSFMFMFNDAGNELRLRKSRIEDLEAGLRRFVRSTEDEIAAPLRSLESSLGAVAGVAPGDPAARALGDAHDLALRVENLVAAARLRMSGTPLASAPIDVGALIGRAVARHQAAARAAGVSIEVSVPDGPISIDGDEALIQQAVANVIDNAIRYNAPQGTVTVNLSPAAGATRFRLVISDTGRGVTEEELRTLTAIRRFRGDEGRNRRPGAPGLGLAVAREVADRSNLQLELRRRDSGGFEAEFSGR